MPTLNEIITLAQEYIPQDNLDLLRKAYDLAKKVYKDNPDRKSGEPYIAHPLAVCHILVTMKMDIYSLVAGLLHKALRGPAKSTEKELIDLFGKDVAVIVSGTTKIDDIQFNSRLDFKAENVKKLLLAMTKDIRVLLVKLADHLHDMQTLKYVDKARQREMAQDTKDLFAPMASRLGIDWIKRELEDLAFQYLHPEDFEEISTQIRMNHQEREDFVEEIKSILHRELRKDGIHNFRIQGRPKHLYSIFRKLQAQNIPLEKVYDKVAFRVITKEVNECYEVMGIVHSLWKPIASRFKDFISTPKANLYQSLHTSVVGPHGDFMEVQIRTESMDELANDGIAAHWAYKEGATISKKDARLFHWLKQLVQGMREAEDSQEFLETVRDELDHSEVYVLTPNGDVKELPVGSTPLDFAYAIHTQVGNRCVGAKIEGRIVPLKYEIKSGDVIEILTSQNQHPNRRWLSLVKTGRAKSRIRHWLKQEEQALALEKGREICERELRKHDLNLKKIIKTGHFKTLLKSLSCNGLEDLMRKVGIGKLTIDSIIHEMLPKEIKEEQKVKEAADLAAEPVHKKPRKKITGSPVRIDGIDDMLVKISNCCMPMPGDSIMGFITAGRGVTVHKTECRNFLATDPQRHIEVEWVGGSHQGNHKAKVRIMAYDRKGVLMSVCNIITTDDADILDMEAHTSQSIGQARIEITMAVRDKEHLASLITKLRNMDEVLEVSRM